MKIEFGESQAGRAELDFYNSPGVRIIANSGAGKSTLLETIARTSKRANKNLRVIVISTTGRFDYDLGFDFEFYSPIRHREKMFEVLNELRSSMNEVISLMEGKNTKDVTQVPGHRASLLIVDELESCEEVLEKKEKETFARLLTLRINGGRKTQNWTITATQSQDLHSTLTRTRGFEYTIMGRPQTKAICHALCIDEKYFLDSELKKGRLLLIANGDCQIIKVRKET